MVHQLPQNSVWPFSKLESRSVLCLLTVSFLSSWQDLTLDTDLTAANGKKIKALEIFAYALQYFKEQALKVGCVAAPVVVGGALACGESGWAVPSESRMHPPNCRGGGGGQKWCSHCGNSLAGPQKLKQSSRDPAIPLLGVYPRETETRVHANTCT